MKEITRQEARAIIETRNPSGKFWLKENGKYTGIDNETGDAWTEEFDTEEEFFAWLNGEERKD